MAEIGEPLSDRELAVLQCLVAGATNREIARDLDISHNTVKVHVRNIFAKLGVSSRTEASTLAIQRGLISIPGLEAETTAPTVAPDALDEADDPLIAPDSAARAAMTSTVDRSSVAAERLAVSPATADQARPGAGPRWPVIGLAGLLVVLFVATGFLAVRLLTGDQSPAETGPDVAAAAATEEPIGNTRWFQGMPMPTGRSGMALVSVGLDLYLIGGEVEAGIVNLVDVFETDTRSWHSASAKPTAVGNATAAVLFGEIYVPGGRLADGQPTAVVEAFSPANNAWRPVTALPSPVAGGVALSDGSLLYLFGGWDGQNYLTEGYAYDPSSDTWESLPAMQHPRAFASGDLLANRLYVVGGYDGQAELAVCEYFDLAEQVWYACPDLSYPRAGAGAAALGNNRLYVIGGGIEGEVPYGEEYVLDLNVWQAIEIPMLAEAPAWPSLGVTNVETRIYVMGGQQKDIILADSYVYAPFVHQTYLPSVGIER
jgi:DNA-binding CsgD family transcriptional regulator